MQIKNEDEILDIGVRKRIIQDIDGQENRARKSEMYKRYQCYKDQTFRYVIALLLKQFDRDTVEEMAYARSNLGISRKVVDKLARVYKYGVDRDLYIDDEKIEDDILTPVARALQVDQVMKKTNRYFKLFKNVAVYIRPKPVSADKDAPMTIKLTALAPYLYDVVEMADEREKPLVYILSNYSPNRGGGGSGAPLAGLAIVPGTDGRGGNGLSMVQYGDGKDQTIADKAEDADAGRFVFWSANHHFVCNAQGQILEDMGNEIGELPFKNYAEDQDGSFWAVGGDDLTDGAILINAMITHIMHIGVTQGYGQMVLTGKDLPKSIKVGPNKAIRLTHEGEDPVPTFAFVSANPPLDQLRALVEMYVALLLTTNNLSTSGVSSNLAGGVSFPSGIAMLIDKAESMEDVEDQRQVFEDNEPGLWKIISKWHTLLKSKGEIIPELADLSFPEEFEVKTTFHEPKAIESERERLETIKLKREMGLLSALEALRQENPELSKEQAEEKLKEILEEKMREISGELVKKDDQAGMDVTAQPEQEAGLPLPDHSVTSAPTQDVQAVQDTALNGAQVTSMVDVVKSVAEGMLPRDAAAQILVRAFLVTPEEADSILGSAGKGFKPNESNGQQDNGQPPNGDDRPGAGPAGRGQAGSGRLPGGADPSKGGGENKPGNGGEI